MRRLSACNLAMVLALVLGCQTPDESGGAATAVQAAPTEPVAPGPAKSCQEDTDCEGFLRCLGGFCAEPPAMTGQVQADTPIARFYNGSEQVGEFFLEVADAYEEQRRGLMYRKTMRDNWGMIFVYPYDEVHQFWMKNTYLSLDMLFIGGDGVVRGIVADVPPLTLESRGISEPSRHVLELKAGTCARLGIKAGTVMRLENAPGIPMAP